MGIDYSFQVYVHRRDAGRLLAGVAALCATESDTDEWTDVVLPDGASMRVPGTYGFANHRTVILADAVAGSSMPTFDLVPWFPADEPLLRYSAASAAERSIADERPGPGGAAQVRVALTYLYVTDGSKVLPEHWVFDFTPATSGQSRVYLSSQSVRSTFTDLAASVASPLCLLDVEELYAIVLTVDGLPLSTLVPGPCILWNRLAPSADAYRELRERLSGAPPASHWIIGPEHVDYARFATKLAEHSGVPGTVI